MGSRRNVRRAYGKIDHALSSARSSIFICESFEKIPIPKRSILFANFISIYPCFPPLNSTGFSRFLFCQFSFSLKLFHYKGNRIICKHTGIKKPQPDVLLCAAGLNMVFIYFWPFLFHSSYFLQYDRDRSSFASVIPSFPNSPCSTSGRSLLPAVMSS